MSNSNLTTLTRGNDTFQYDELLYELPCAGHIYLIKCQQYYKIGLSGNIEKRLKAIKNMIPFDVERIDTMISFNVKEDEKKLHRLFREYKHRNEWFLLPKTFVESRSNWFTSDYSPKSICESIYRQMAIRLDRAISERFTEPTEFPFDRVAIKTLISINDYKLASMSGTDVEDIHNDRYNGLYRKTASQLRADAGIENGTPLDMMSSRDLQMNSLTNTLAIEADDANLLFDFANDIRDSYQKRMGKPLTPIWEEKHLRPNQAKAIAYSPEYQTELPVS